MKQIHNEYIEFGDVNIIIALFMSIMWWEYVHSYQELINVREALKTLFLHIVRRCEKSVLSLRPLK